MILIALLLFLSSSETPITKDNWQSHPAIIEIRAMYQRLQDDRNTGRLKVEARKFDNCFDDEEERKLYTDNAGTPRIYSFSEGSDHWAMEIEVYYDEAGVRRFAFVEIGAVNGTSRDLRFYFSKTGDKIWENDKLLEGEGYAGIPDPIKFIPRNARKAFITKNPCEER